MSKQEKKYKKIAIIAEFNPLHTGHQKIIKLANSLAHDTIIIMSGNVVQRGDIACIDKFKRAKHAIDVGASMVVEIPSIFVVSSAKYFAKAGVEIAHSLNCDALIFGSEIDDVSLMEKIATFKENTKFKLLLNSFLKDGESYTKSYSKAIEHCLNINTDILKMPNSTLAIEYIKWCRKFSINYHVVTRENQYASDIVVNDFISAYSIREHLKQNTLANIKKFVSKNTYFDLLKNNYNTQIETYYKLLRTAFISSKNLKKYYDLNEGIEKMLLKNLMLENDYESFLNSCASKRYTKSKIRRSSIHVLFKITKQDALIVKKSCKYSKLLAVQENKKYLLDNNFILKSYSEIKNIFKNDRSLQIDALVDNISSIIREEKIKYNSFLF